MQMLAGHPSHTARICFSSVERKGSCGIDATNIGPPIIETTTFIIWASCTLTANQPRDAWEARKLRWGTTEVVERGVSNDAQVGQRFFLDPTDEALTVTINAMEVKTYLVRLA